MVNDDSLGHSIFPTGEHSYDFFFEIWPLAGFFTTDTERMHHSGTEEIPKSEEPAWTHDTNKEATSRSFLWSFCRAVSPTEAS